MTSNKNMKFFKYNELKKEFKEFEDKLSRDDILNSDSINLFVDPHRKRVWIWHGSNTTTKMKFLAATLTPTIRDRYGIDFKIVAVDEGNEPLVFKIMMGLEEESDYKEAQIRHSYARSNEDLELLDSLSREKELLLLKKIKDSKEEAEHKLYCKYCGSKLPEGQTICHVCGKMVL